MDEEAKLNIQNWDLKLDDRIKYITSIEKNFTYILTQNFFSIYDKSKDSLTKYPIPESNNNLFSDLNKNQDFIGSRIWPDYFGIHIIFKLDGIVYYYNNCFQDNKKIKQLNFIEEGNKEYIEPYALSFNNINKNQKNSDEIIFTDINSIIYTLNIKIDDNGEMTEKIRKIFDLKNLIKESVYLNDKDKIEDYNKENNELIDNYLTKIYSLMDKDDYIYDIKIFVGEEKITVGKKINIIKHYFIWAISKRIIFQFKGKNSINETFSKIKNENNTTEMDYKIFPKKNKISLDNPRLQIFKSSKKNKNYFFWNNEFGFIFWEITKEKGENNKPSLPLIQKDFNLYKYIKLNSEGKYEKKPCPLACARSSRHIYFLYNDSLVIINTLTKKIIHTENLKDEKYFDMIYNPHMNKVIIYSKRNIIKVSFENEINILWKDYIQNGDYESALQNYQKDDENFKAKLHKLKANDLFQKKNYEPSGLEYVLSDENFEHVSIKYSKLNNIDYLINYLNLLNKIKFSKIEENKNNQENGEEENNNFFIQKYLINTWLLQLLLEKEGNDMNNENTKEKENKKIEKTNIKQLMYDSIYIDSDKYIDKLIIFNSLRYYGRHNDFIFLAGKKNDYRAIIFDLVNHYKYKEAINNLMDYLSYSTDEDYLKKLIKIFFMYINIFVKESPNDVIDLLSNYCHLIDDPKKIVRVLINFDDIYKNQLDDKVYEKVISFIKRLLSLSKNNKKSNDISLNLDDSVKQNFYNLYLLYLSNTYKKEYLDELDDFLKKLIKDSNKSRIKFSSTKIIDKIKIFDFSFAENIFKNHKSALSLLYCLKRQYNKSLLYAVECKDINIPIFIANSIVNPKKKKEIWFSLFNLLKSKGMKTVEELLEKSYGVLTITDILPHLMGNVQLKDIQMNLNKCINEYETKLRKLKHNIKDFSKSEEIINKKINRVVNYGQKSLEIKFEDINCSVCLKNMKEINFYLFPCKHAFDFDCLINLLFYYDNRKIGDENFKIRMDSIKKILKIFSSTQSLNKNLSILDKKNSLNIGGKQNIIKGFFKNLTMKNNAISENFDLEKEEKIVNNAINSLDELLNEECPLCGNEVILGTQTKFGDEESYEWNI